MEFASIGFAGTANSCWRFCHFWHKGAHSGKRFWAPWNQAWGLRCYFSMYSWRPKPCMDVVFGLSASVDLVAGARLIVGENPPKFQNAVVWEPNGVQMWFLWSQLLVLAPMWRYWKVSGSNSKWWCLCGGYCGPGGDFNILRNGQSENVGISINIWSFHTLGGVFRSFNNTQIPILWKEWAWNGHQGVQNSSKVKISGDKITNPNFAISQQPLVQI